MMATPVFWSPEFILNTPHPENDPQDPGIAALKNGMFVAVWDQNGDEGVQGQLFNADGTKSGSAFSIASKASALQPVVAVLSDGRFAVAWTQDADIWARIYNPEGTPFNRGGADGTQAFRINTTTTDVQYLPVITALSGGGFAVAFADQNGFDIRALAFGSNGQPVTGTDFVANATTTNLQTGPSITALGNNTFVVLYEDLSSGNKDVRGRILNPDGTPVPGTSEFMVPTDTAGEQREPVITALENGRFVAIWAHNSAAGGGSSVKGQIFAADGTKVGQPFQVNATTLGSQEAISVTATPDGGFAVVFQDDSTASTVLRLTVFDSMGTMTWDELLLSESVSDGPAITALADGRLIVSWIGDKDFTAVSGRIVDARTRAIAPGELDGTGFDDQYIGTGFGDAIGGAGGADHLRGEGGSDTLDGGAGADLLDGGSGLDRLSGGSGNDTYIVDGADTVIDSDGFDTVLASADHALSAGIEVLNATGSAGVSLTGNALDNTVTGNAAANRLDGGVGADRLAGGLGNDTFLVDNASDLVTESLGGGRDTVLASTSYTLAADAEVEVLALSALSSRASYTLTGSNFANAITGHAGVNILNGQGGNDMLKAEAGKDRVYGGAGNDALHGGLGNDKLYGGTGRDIFVFDTRMNARTNVDRIDDYKTRDDTIWLENKVFTKVGKGTFSNPQKLKADLFTTGSKAADAEDRIIYDKAKGVLYYDKDGTGASAQVKIATLNKNLNMTHSEFFII